MKTIFTFFLILAGGLMALQAQPVCGTLKAPVLSQTSLPSAGSVSFSWTNVSATSYTLAAPGATGCNGTKALSCTATGLGTGTFNFRVTATRGCRVPKTGEPDIEEKVSNTISVTIAPPPPPIPAAPTGLVSGSIAATSFEARWDGSNSATSYQMDVSTSAGTIVFSTSVPNTVVTVSHLTPNTRYFWKVRAVNRAGGTSAYVQSSFLTAAIAPPSSVEARASFFDGFSLGWSESDGAVRYAVDISTSSTFDVLEVLADSVITTRVITVQHLRAATTYYSRVRAIDANNNVSANSGTLAYTIQSVPVPQNLEAIRSDDATSFHLSWVQPTSIPNSSYRITVSQNPDLPSPVAILETPETSIQVMNLTPKTTYYAAVATVAPEGTSKNSSTVSITTRFLVNSVGSTATTAQWNWDAIDGAAQYTLSLIQGATIQTFETPNTVFTFTGLIPGTFYNGIITAKASDGSVITSSVNIQFTTGVLSAPEVAANSTTSALLLNWVPITEATSYEIVVSTFSDLSSPLFTQQTTEHQITVPDLDAKTRYYVGARSIAPTGVSAFFTTSAATKFLLTTAEALSSTSVHLAWDPVETAVSYTVIFTILPATPISTVVLTTTDTDFVITDLLPGQNYRFSVTAYTDNPVLIISSEAVTLQTLSNIAEPNLLYPNPAKDGLTVQLPTDDKSSISIKDMSGRPVFQSAYQQSSVKIDLVGIQPGLYVVEIIQGAMRKSMLLQVD